MNRLAAVSTITLVAGVALLLGTVAERARLSDYLIRPDHSAVDAWTAVSTALIGIGVLAGLLALHAAEIRRAMQEAARANR